MGIPHSEFARAGLSIVVRLSSFILFCIGVRIFWNGASRLLAPLFRSAAR